VSQRHSVYAFWRSVRFRVVEEEEEEGKIFIKVKKSKTTVIHDNLTKNRHRLPENHEVDNAGHSNKKAQLSLTDRHVAISITRASIASRG